MLRQVVPVRRVKTLTHLQYKIGNVKVIRQGLQKRTRPQFRLTCVAKKRFCLTSLMFSTGRLRPEVQPLTLLNNSYDRKGTSFVYIPLKNGTPLTNLLNKNNRCIYFSHLQQQKILFRIRRFVSLPWTKWPETLWPRGMMRPGDRQAFFLSCGK